MPSPSPYEFYYTHQAVNSQNPSQMIVVLKAVVDIATGAALFSDGCAFNLTHAALTAAKVAKPMPAAPSILGAGTGN